MVLGDLKFGGSQRQGLELARRLDPERYAVDLWRLTRWDPLAPVARGYGLAPRAVGRTYTVMPSTLLRLGARLAASRPQIIMPLTSIPNVWCRLLKRLAGRPLLVGTCRGGAPARQMERWLWPLADHVITNSEVLRGRLMAECHTPPERVSRIPNGVDVEFFRPGPRPKGGGPVVLAVGRLVGDKDHATLIRAFAEAAREFPAARLRIVGDGPLKEELQRLAAELGVAERVRFSAGRDDLRPVYGAADVLAHSSVREALPNVVLEAMASGLAVAGTAVGGVPEMVAEGRTGLLSPKGDAQGLAGSLKFLLGHAAEAAAMGAAGRARAEAEFSFAAMVARHQDLLDRLWEARHGRG